VDYAELKTGQLLSPSEVFDLVEEIHGREEDFYEGDITDRIWKYPQYEFQPEFELIKLDLAEWSVDFDLVHEWVEDPEFSFETLPPIVVGHYVRNNNRHSIIDGIHRANYVLALGRHSIPAFVGKRK
jgi:hypothetical protein